MFKIIHRYIFMELLAPFFSALAVFTFIFLLSRILQLTELMINKGVSFWDIAQLFIYATPYFFVLTIPMAVLFSVVLTFMRLSSDNEITALKGAGLSLYQLLPAVATLCLSGFALTLFVSTYLLPRGNTALADHIFKMATSRAEVIIRERVFVDEFEGLVLYIEKVDDKTMTLNKIFVADERDPKTETVILAKKGSLIRDPGRRVLVLRLFDGVIDRLAMDFSQTETINFRTYDLKVNVHHMVAQRKAQGRHREELTMTELAAKLKTMKKGTVDYYLYFMVYHERLSIPFACLSLGLLGVALGIQSRARRTSSGLVLAVSAFLSYYLLYVAAKGLGETGLYPPLLGLWTPNIIFSILTIYLLVRTANERPWMVMAMVGRITRRISRKFSRP